MKRKAGFRVYFTVFVIALVAATVAATLLKLFAIDPQSGLVNTESFPLAGLLLLVFRLALLLPILFWFLITLRRRSMHDFPVSYRHIPSSILAVLTGLSMIAYSLFSLTEQIIKDRTSEIANKMILVAVIFFGIMGGISMIAGGFRPKYGVYGKPGAMMGFYPALWQLATLLVRFNSFMAVTTVIDTTMQVVFMCFAAMFLIGQSRIIFGLGIRNGKTYAIPSGLSVALVGLVFTLSNGISYFLGGATLFGGAMSLPEFLYIFFLSLYAVVFLAGYSRSIRVV